ncbi:MAG: PadR family transcriptional regulator [bacterium]|nr:PadR family transcriptional regulator [bacterium]
MKDLTKFEEILLVTIWRLNNQAYGVQIRQHVNKLTKKSYTYGNLYSVLGQLRRKGFVTRSLGESTSERGGKRKIIFSVTKVGLESMKAAREFNEELWDGISELATD